MSRRTFVVSAAGAALATPATTARKAPATSSSTTPDRTADTAPPVLGVPFPGTGDGYWQDGRPSPALHRDLDTLRAYGVEVVRVDVSWHRSQPEDSAPCAGHPYNQRLAGVLDAAAERRIAVLVTLHESPLWTRGGAAPRGSHARFPDDPDTIRPWAKWLAATYGDRVLAWEVWCEPNQPATTGVTAPAERAARYAALLRACAAGLRSVPDPAPVVLGGPCHTDHRFVRDIYAAGGRDHFDVLALRPRLDGRAPDAWSEEAPGIDRVTNFPAVAEAMRAYRDGDKPVWWTEFGFAPQSAEETPRGLHEPAEATRLLVRSFELARVRYPQVRLAVISTVPWPLRPQLPGLRDYFAAHPATRPLL
ncbi:cellulase family glycosylhydrolase [Streptomyces olivoreticuli]|uniref:cellulase family glycosylhydrolase n=1 Tax=Streptomyces olivoreticuli TaxID=68246 RepID=UPI000E279CE7|nr:cellulase family glycosylhydrolase [Streptomyces olivoreticuli]